MMVPVPENNVEPDTSQVQPNKRRRKKSIVWEHFTVEAVSDDCTRACCKQCKQTFAYSTGTKLSGTSHLKRHIATGTCLGSRRKERNQLRSSDSNGNGSVANPPRRKYNGGSCRVNFQFDQELSRHELAKMIIMHEYSVDIVNHSAFVSFIKRLQPKFQMVDFNTIQEDCVAIYQKEKQELFEMLNGTPGRVSLSMDLLTSSETLGYVFLTGHFINSSWKLHSRILNVVMVPFPYNKDVLSHAVGRCLSEWGLENKLFSLTLSRSLFRNDTGSLRSYLSDRSLLKANGQLLIEHCFTQVLSSMVQDALGGMQDIIDKVRKSIQYVKKSQAHEERFLELKQKLQVPSTKNLSLDDQTQWNSTYFMLLAALELKEVFSCLDTADPGYQLILSMDNWNQIDILCNYLKLLYDGADAIIRAVNPTSEIFFHEAWKIQLELLCWVQSPDPLILNFLNPLREKFDTYWKECRLVLAMAVVFDPQYKMKILEDRFPKIYGDEASMYLKEVDETIHLLFSEYTPQFLLEHVSMVEIKTEEPSFDDAGDCGSLPPADDFFDSDVFMSELSSSMHAKSELDQYLEEGLVSASMDFNVLNWWDDNNFKYPCLSKMARDILSIPMCAVGIEAVFGNGCREMKHTWSCLQPETVQALVCAKDWLKYGSSETISNALVKVEVPPY